LDFEFVFRMELPLESSCSHTPPELCCYTKLGSPHKTSPIIISNLKLASLPFFVSFCDMTAVIN